MIRLSKRELHRPIDALETQEYPGVCTFLFREHIGDGALVNALAADSLARNGNQGINIVSTDPESFKERVGASLVSLQERDGSPPTSSRMSRFSPSAGRVRYLPARRGSMSISTGR